MPKHAANDALTSQYFKPETESYLRTYADHSAGVSPDKAFSSVVQDAREVFNDRYQTLSHDGPVPLGPAPLNDLEYGQMHPVAISQSLAKKYEGFSEEDRRNILEILRKTYPIDRTTGYHAKQSMPAIVGLGHFCAQHTDIPVCIVEGDFTNMAKSNVVIGRKKTDKLIYAISSLVKKSLEEEAKEVIGVRAGGDETQLVVYGLTAEQVDKILLDKVHPAINLLSAKFGAHTIEHSKKGKMPGFGAAFACADLGKETDEIAIQKYLHTHIGRRKEADARLRFGMVDEEGVQRYIRDIYTPQLKESGVTEWNIPGHIEAALPHLRSLAESTRSRWEALTEKGGAYHDLAKEYNAKNPRDFFDAYSVAHSQARSDNFDKIKLPKRATIAERIPFSEKTIGELNKDPSSPLEAPEILRLRTALKTFGFTKAAQAQGDILRWNASTHKNKILPELHDSDPTRARLQEMVVDLMHAFDAPDPSTRCKSASLMYEDAERYKTKFGGMKVIHFETTNLSGLNNVGTPIGDSMLRETAKYIKEALTKNPDGANAEQKKANAAHMADHVYYEGNGRFKAFVPLTYPPYMAKQVERSVKKSLQDHIGSELITTFARNTYARPTDGRFQESEVKITALEDRIAELEKVAAKPIIKMSDIPHPKKSGKTLGIGCYVGNIGPNQSVEDGMRAINRAAEAALNHGQGNHRE